MFLDYDNKMTYIQDEVLLYPKSNKKPVNDKLELQRKPFKSQSLKFVDQRQKTWNASLKNLKVEKMSQPNLKELKIITMISTSKSIYGGKWGLISRVWGKVQTSQHYKIVESKFGYRGKFYITAARYTLLRRNGCWATKKKERKLKYMFIEMQKLRQKCGMARKNILGNGTSSFNRRKEKIEEYFFRSFGMAIEGQEQPQYNILKGYIFLKLKELGTCEHLGSSREETRHAVELKSI